MTEWSWRRTTPALLRAVWSTGTLYGPAARVREGVEQWREAGITTPVLVPLSPDGNQMNGLKAVFAAFERRCERSAVGSTGLMSISMVGRRGAQLIRQAKRVRWTP